MALEWDRIAFDTQLQDIEFGAVGFALNFLHVLESNHLIVRVASEQHSINFMIFLRCLDHQAPNIVVEIVFCLLVS